MILKLKKRVSKLRKSYQEKVKIDEEKLISQLDGKLLQKKLFR